jgi:hypothetical protein
MSLRDAVRFHLFELTKILVGHREFCNSCIMILNHEDTVPSADVKSGDFTVNRPRLKYLTWKKIISTT